MGAIELSGNQATQSIPVDPNQCYGTSMDPDQQQDMKLTKNQAYAATPNIPVGPNPCYVTTTPSVDPDQLYAIAEGENNITVHNTAHGSSSKLNIPQTTQQQEYDYIIP